MGGAAACCCCSCTVAIRQRERVVEGLFFSKHLGQHQTTEFSRCSWSPDGGALALAHGWVQNKQAPGPAGAGAAASSASHKFTTPVLERGTWTPTMFWEGYPTLCVRATAAVAVAVPLE